MQIPIKNIIFIDIETATNSAHFNGLSDAMQKEWARKAQYLKGYEDMPDRAEKLYEDKAAIYAEFGRIVCISVGAFMQESGAWKLALKSIFHNNEQTILEEFLKLMQQVEHDKREVVFCGHNIKEFDLPYLCRRLYIHGLPLPKALHLSHKKPWEIKHIDTLELWRFGDYKHYISLSLLAEILGIPSPKDDMNGAMVSNVFWQDHDLKRIATYCSKDVVTTAKVYLKLAPEDDMNFEEKYL